MSLKGELQAVPFLAPRMDEHDNCEHKCGHKWHGHRQPPAAPGISRFGKPTQQQRGDDEDADGVPDPPGPPIVEVCGPWDLTCDPQTRNPDGGVRETTDGPSQP